MSDQNQNQNQYQQYGYDNFEQAEQVKQAPVTSGFYSNFRARFVSPGFATFLLLTLSAGVVYYAVIAEPKQPDISDLPVISADASSYKTKPKDTGGMEVANKDSTIFGTVRGKEIDEKPPLENLLAESRIDKLQEFAKEAGDLMNEKPMPENLLANVGGSSKTSEAPASAGAEAVSVDVSADTPTEKTAEIPHPKPVKKPESIAKPERLHAPGSSPDTLAFVRSALGQKAPAGTQESSDAAVAAAAASVEPAAGFASGARSFYVQLSSIKDQARSDAEWSKLQKKYPAMLENAPHRVQRADLGERGTYYRIQAGPFEKDGAVSVCEQIKAVNPNGCLVVK